MTSHELSCWCKWQLDFTRVDLFHLWRISSLLWITNVVHLSIMYSARINVYVKNAVIWLHDFTPYQLACYQNFRKQHTLAIVPQCPGGLVTEWWVDCQLCCGWLSSRVVSVLDSFAEGPRFKSQLRRCQVTVLGKMFTPIVPVHQAAKLVAALLTVARVTAGLAESSGSLVPGLWLTSPAGWLPRTEISSGTLCSAVEYGLPLPFCVVCGWQRQWMPVALWPPSLHPLTQATAAAAIVVLLLHQPLVWLTVALAGDVAQWLVAFIACSCIGIQASSCRITINWLIDWWMAECLSVHLSVPIYWEQQQLAGLLLRAGAGSKCRWIAAGGVTSEPCKCWSDGKEVQRACWFVAGCIGWPQTWNTKGFLWTWNFVQPWGKIVAK